ncbi:SAM-dependent methyltransferase [Kribbella sp. NPDC004536]|uniref:SAM-dependent methyltransferase n=1 Tax=Kribbella sp. NPDC004536 TaxID=3364106 RepID=UPI0036B5435F
MTSTRYDGDSWDLSSSVGSTATMAATARAIATRTDRRLIDDPFAAPLVQAVGVDLFTRLATGAEPPGEFVQQVWIDIAKIRTKYYDEFFLRATGSGIRQAVILASGLDSRAYRLAWPAGTVVYELDKPDVVDFKTRTLAGLGAEPTADHRVVPGDLRDDWPQALRAAGLDPAQPIAWSAEGLLGYLPPDAQDRLLDTITSLSAPGSRLATESRPNPQPGDETKAKEHLQQLSERLGTDNMTNLRYFGQRNEAAPYLAARGWTLDTATIRDLLATNNLPPLVDDTMQMGDMLYLTAFR